MLNIGAKVHFFCIHARKKSSSWGDFSKVVDKRIQISTDEVDSWAPS